MLAIGLTVVTMSKERGVWPTTRSPLCMIYPGLSLCFSGKQTWVIEGVLIWPPRSTCLRFLSTLSNLLVLPEPSCPLGRTAPDQILNQTQRPPSWTACRVYAVIQFPFVAKEWTPKYCFFLWKVLPAHLLIKREASQSIHLQCIVIVRNQDYFRPN